MTSLVDRDATVSLPQADGVLDEPAALDALYPAHLATLQARAEAALRASGHDTLVVAAGIEKFAFLDDRPYLFQPNPHFKHWVPLTEHPASWLVVRPGERLRVIVHQPADYWHLPPTPPQGAWVEAVELIPIARPEEALTHLPRSLAGVACIGEADAALGPMVPNNPQPLLDALHWERAVKTRYELACLRAASARAVRGHRAAEAAFHAGGSEAAIHRAYLEATGHTDRDLPYGNIVALNEHAAVLHYQHQQVQPPAVLRSFLIDAGASVRGYASDITRTHASRGLHDAPAGLFGELIARMDALQLQLVDQVRAGVDYRAIHLATHAGLARVLRESQLARGSEEALVAEGVTAAFFPHGIGHLLGLQVHDAGGFLASPQGGTREKPAGHPYLRLTRELAAGMAVTIEPGLYIIPMLLDGLRARPGGALVDWPRVTALGPFGGVRIEDDVVCRADGPPENLTRDAFAAAGR